MPAILSFAQGKSVAMSGEIRHHAMIAAGTEKGFGLRGEFLRMSGSSRIISPRFFVSP